MKSILKIVSVGTPTPITKKDGTQCLKQTVILRELGGKYEDSYVTTLFCETPCSFPEGTTIAAALRFQTRNYEGNDYQDITLQEYQLVGFPPLPKAPNLPSLTQSQEARL